MPQLQTLTDASEAPAVDVMSLLGRCLGNFQIVERVLLTFRATGAADLVQLQEAIERADFTTIADIAHRFQGSASNVSALRLRELLKRAEGLAHEESLPELLMIMSQLPLEWDAVERQCDTIAPASGSSAGGIARQLSRPMETCHAGAGC